jgi:glycosyltransferase involved in cell wall biosynthesis
MTPPRRRKVFLVLECGSPHGVGHQIAMICRRIDRARFETCVVYATRPDTPPEEFERMTAAADRHFHVPDMVRPISPRRDLSAFLSLCRLMGRERPDVVHAESSKAGVLARAAAWLTGVPRVYYSPHGYGFLQTDAGPAARRLYWWIEKSLSWIGNIIACSSGEAELARRLSWGREVFLVRNLFALEEDIPDVPHSTEVVVGAVGRLTPARNPEAFLRLAKTLSVERPETRFVWVGGGELEDAIRREAKRLGLDGFLEITGHVTRATVLEKLARMDVFVHFSRWEGGAPIALHEAMAFGKPVVVSDIAGNRELVRPGVSGLLAAGEAELQDDVRRLVASEELRRLLGRGAKDFLEQEVSAEKTMAALEDLYSR